MTNIEFNINRQEIVKKKDVMVVEKSRGEYKAVFSLSDDWESVPEKKAYFTRRSDGLCRTADLDAENTCIIPWECIELPSFFVSVAGGNLRTTTKAEVFVSETGYRENAEKSGSVPEVIRTPQSLAEKNGILSLVDKNGTPIGNGVEIPKTTVDAELSDTSENPVQNKAIKAYIDEKFTTPVLLDTFTVPEGGDPVLSFEKKLTGQGWQRIWLSGEIYSSDTTATQTFHLRTGAGSEIFRLVYKHWNLGKVYVSAEMRRMPNGLIIGEIALSIYQYTNENGMGDVSKSVGRFNTQQIAGVHISLDSQTQMFAAGTRIEVWGLEK